MNTSICDYCDKLRYSKCKIPENFLIFCIDYNSKRYKIPDYILLEIEQAKKDRDIKNAAKIGRYIFRDNYHYYFEEKNKELINPVNKIERNGENMEDKARFYRVGSVQVSKDKKPYVLLDRVILRGLLAHPFDGDNPMLFCSVLIDKDGNKTLNVPIPYKQIATVAVAEDDTKEIPF